MRQLEKIVKRVIKALFCLTFFLFLLPTISFAQETIELTYGQAFILDFHLVKADGIDLKTDAVCAAGDITIMKDQDDEANTTNCFVDEGKGYSVSLTAAELTASQVVLYLVDQTVPKVWLDHVVHINLSRTAPTGIAQAGCTAPCKTIDLATTAPSTDDQLNNNFTVALVGGTGVNQSQCIVDFVGSSRRATVVDNWVVAPDATTLYTLLYTPNCSGKIVAGGIVSGTLDASALTAITDAILAKVVESEGNITVGQFMKYAGAVLFGRSSGNGLVFKTPNNNATRVTVTVDGSKNRTAVSLNP